MPSHETGQPLTTVALNLRSARDSRNWSQKDVANAIGVTPSDVSRWERGAVEPGRKYRHLLADLYFDGDLSALYREPTTEAAA